MWSINNLIRYTVMGSVLLLCAGLFSPALAQQGEAQIEQETEYTMPAWRFGVSGGANFNFYRGTTQNLYDDYMTHAPFGHGQGVGLFAAPVIEYHPDGSLFGFNFKAGYDSRQGEFDDQMSPCGCPLDLSTDLSYITVEPSLRIAPFRSNFFLFTGPRLAFLYDESFEYNKDVNPDFPNATQAENVEGDFDEMESTQFSFQVGAGWDIPLNDNTNKTRFILSPFVSFQPYFGQEPRSIETWNITTLRTGLSFKVGSGKKIPGSTPPPPAPAPVVPNVDFMVDSPKNTEVQRVYLETFPLHTLVFFNDGSTSIPERYISLSAEEAETFDQEKIGPFDSVAPYSRSTRQMQVYYNILNILGDRMRNNPSTTINLIGSSMESQDDAVQMAESVKGYLVDTFGIDASRISTEGNLNTEMPKAETDLDLRREEMRHVTLQSSSPKLLREYMTKPKNFSEITDQEAPDDSFITLTLDGETEDVESWTVEATNDETGETQTFGPYTSNEVRIPGEDLLGDSPEGNFSMVMIGEAENGTTVRRRTTTNVVLWTPTLVEVASRYSVLFGFDSSELRPEYKDYLDEVVIPYIESGATVEIFGHTDIIGQTEYNQELSERRAAVVRDYIDQNVDASNVQIDVVAYGEETTEASFENTHPEQRYYNRTAIIDIVISN
ncbi:OmpA family protein [Gracilimonas mengyeensis]|uniref:Outer membrane protein beta-barrel domain-containing protein n=1 Tax=Gracilimonas mengyeensis TaxID=1302730 RepID=A0A521DHK7_9BACT|nr:OmpA family protein [Gracilimonas mengyeensis]SMO71254.1 Outer membrane protein beta-barrel domain-containing protein [Gracilimonas mengyeensis]